jgi:hypothetical protein
MDNNRINATARAVSRWTTRRGAITILAGGVVAVLFRRDDADAAGGCANVRNRCKRDAQCCSGICKGPNGKKTCRDHGVGSCAPTQDGLCMDLDYGRANCNQTVGCSCYTTSGGARFCGQDETAFCPSVGTCKRDPDCGAGAACAVKQTFCKGCPSTANGPTFCILPCLT